MRTRTVAILAGIGVAVIGGGIAFAYFTNIGSGSGTAGTGSNLPVAVIQTSTVGDMAPGVAAKPLSGNFNNPNPGGVFIKTVTATVSVPSPAPSAIPGIPACAASDYVIVSAAGTGVSATSGDVRLTSSPPAGTGAGVEIPTGTAQGYWGGLTLQFNNKNTNQDNCKNVAVTITYTAA
jgi:hypothetical protein